MEEIITVIGAGNGGMAISAYLASCGVKVNICDMFPQYLEGIKKDKEITLIKDGTTTVAKLNMVTEDVKLALTGAKLVMVITPSFTHKIIAKACYKYLEDGQIIILNPGRTGGAIEFLATIRSLGCHKDVVVGESSTLVYSCRKHDAKTVEVYGTKEELLLGVLPAERTAEAAGVLNKYYPQFKPVGSCIETSLSNIGALFHPTPMLLNIGRIQSDKRGYRWYIDGITPGVAKLVKEIDKERLAIAAVFGVKIFSAEEWLVDSYQTHGADLYEMIQNNDAYKEIQAPPTIEARYVLEDVPMSLVPLSELAKAVGVATPNIDAVIQLTSTIYGRDFRAEGRTLKTMGLENMTKEQIEKYFMTGKN